MFYLIISLLSLNLRGEIIMPPLAKKIPYKLEKFNDVRIDNYFWLKKRDDKDVLSYLNSENRYADYFMSDTKEIKKKIYNELKSRIKEDDETFPAKYKNYFYFTKYIKGKDYPLYYRRKIDGNKDEILVNANDVAKGHSYSHLTSVLVSPDENTLAYAVDFNGRRFYTIYFKDLRTGKILSYKIKNVTPNFVWANDSKTVYYVKQDSETLRWQEVWRFNILTGEHKKVYYEDDETFSVSIDKSNSEKYIFINVESTLTTEIRYASADSADDFKIFRAREKGLEYHIDDADDRFYIRNNDNAKNFKLSYIIKNENYSDKSLWKDLLETRDDVLIEDFDVFKNRVVVIERQNGLINFRIINRADNSFDYIKFPDSVYSAYPGENLEYNTDLFRYNYESMINPPSVYDYNFSDKKSLLLKKKEVPNYNQSDYETQRLWIPVRDGINVPVSIVYKKGIRPDKLYIYGYGSYGYSIEPDFNSTIFSLVDRGFAYAIAHIKGGSELGRKWYEDGRQLKKRNTFYDFIDITKGLIDMGYGKSGIYAEGGSAGGLLMGAISNMAPELYKGIIAEVPFVDVLTTMLDETIPLTTGEYDEWGNPNIKEYYDYIKSYSPYDNVEKKCYPNMLITSGYYDSQVQYWEPAKWTAKLRDNNTCNSVILLKTDMSSGHSGKSGRYNYLKDIAFNYAFVLKVNEQNK